MSDVQENVGGDGIESVCPSGARIADSFEERPLPPFSDEVISFLSSVSNILFRDPAARAFPDVITFGFWCRRASLESMRDSWISSDVRLGRGLVFHVAPSNVPVNFAYSLAAGLLAGNANVVRLPSALFPQVSILCAALEAALTDPAHAQLSNHVRLLRYGRDNARATAWLSTACDVRVIWGGDETVAEIRRSQLAPRAFDVTFADRYSFCVVDAAEYLRRDDQGAIAEGFYNDTYLFDQNACTAPHLVVWLGELPEVALAKELFWAELHSVLEKRYELAAISAVDKREAAFRFAATHNDCRIEPSPDNLVTRVTIDSVEPGIDEWRSVCGYFTEYHARSVNELPPVVDSRFQTLSYLGVDPDHLRQVFVSQRATGVDRIVPIGQTLDFTLEWDGYDLVNTLSRLVTAS